MREEKAEALRVFQRQVGACVGELYRGPLSQAPQPGPDPSEA